jgi:hypothetical protein
MIGAVLILTIESGWSPVDVWVLPITMAALIASSILPRNEKPIIQNPANPSQPECILIRRRVSD